MVGIITHLHVPLRTHLSVLVFGCLFAKVYRVYRIATTNKLNSNMVVSEVLSCPIIPLFPISRLGRCHQTCHWLSMSGTDLLGRVDWC